MDMKKQLFEAHDALEQAKFRIEELKSTAFAISDAMEFSHNNCVMYQGAVNLLAVNLFDLQHMLTQQEKKIWGEDETAL